jgi:ATP-binding cassette subfamily C (CFTR/MRP) protein 1
MRPYCISLLVLQATRVLVTHQLQYLPSAHHVVVLREGRVAEQGSYADLVARGVDFHQFEAEPAEAAAANGQDDSSGGKRDASGGRGSQGDKQPQRRSGEGGGDSAEEGEGGRRHNGTVVPTGPLVAGDSAAELEASNGGGNTASSNAAGLCAAAETGAVFSEVPLLDSAEGGGAGFSRGDGQSGAADALVSLAVQPAANGGGVLKASGCLSWLPMMYSIMAVPARTPPVPPGREAQESSACCQAPQDPPTTPTAPLPFAECPDARPSPGTQSRRCASAGASRRPCRLAQAGVVGQADQG